MRRRTPTRTLAIAGCLAAPSLGARAHMADPLIGLVCLPVATV